MPARRVTPPWHWCVGEGPPLPQTDQSIYSSNEVTRKYHGEVAENSALNETAWPLVALVCSCGTPWRYANANGSRTTKARPPKIPTKNPTRAVTITSSMACFFEASEEPGFEIYEDSTATDGEVNGSVPRTQLPSESTSADDTDSALAAAIKLVTLNDKTPVAWVTDGCPAALIDRNKLTCRFFINTGAIRCCCYFVPHGNDIEVENDSDVTIHISNVGQSYEVERDKGTRRLPPGVWLLATEVGAHAAVLRIASCADTAQGAPADVLPNKRLCSGSQHRLQSVHAHDVDTPPERCERGLQRPAREGLTGTISGICYRKQFRKSSGGVITMSHSATERQLPLTSKARVWESCVKACRGLDHVST